MESQFGNLIPANLNKVHTKPILAGDFWYTIIYLPDVDVDKNGYICMEWFHTKMFRWSEN